jgi:3-oxoacyl-[acyl-carrier protein] reductase
VETLSGKAAVVTGGASGIGLGIATVLAQEGASVGLADVDMTRAQAAADALTDQGHAAVAVQVDVTDRASTEAMAEAVRRAFGRIDILAANAGIYPMAAFEAIDDAAWDRVMDTNVKGALHAVQACLPSMLESGYGRIVLTSSITGPITGYPGWCHYGATKAAQLGFLRTAAIELAPKGITINAVMPGNIETEGLAELGPEYREKMESSIPQRKLGTVDDIGYAALFFATDEAGYITGQTIVVDGGQVLPESMMAMEAM